MQKCLAGSLVILLAVLLPLSAMPAPDGGNGPEKPVIAVSILPQQFFVEQIAGEEFDILVLVGPGQSPHSYEPTPRQFDTLSRASGWILSGTDFEEALLVKVRSRFPDLPVIDGTEGVVFRHLDAHDHGHDDSHGHTVDPHSWLGRTPAKIMAKHMLEALSLVNPARAPVYQARYESLVSSIDAVFDDLAINLAPLKGTTVLVYHPAFGYFLDEFGLHQEAVETGGKEPTVRTLAMLVEEARSEQAKAIFVQKQFSPDSAKRIADELGVPVVPLDPLAADWLDNIRRMGHALERTLIPNP